LSLYGPFSYHFILYLDEKGFIRLFRSILRLQGSISYFSCVFYPEKERSTGFERRKALNKF